MTPTQAQYYLGSFMNHEVHLNSSRNVSFKIERMQNLLKELSDPQKHLKIIHVAGSKGKGSICALTANILKHAGYKVGLYTSPHLNSYRERIRILNQKSTSKVNLNSGDAYLDLFDDMISEKELCAMLSEVQLTIDLIRFDRQLGRLTYFEVFTALALYYFSKQQCDVVVLETGLGGRLDATNAAHSLIAAIAPISLEHTSILGTDMTQIAYEKAAIIKNFDQKVIIAPQEQSVQEVLDKRCAQFHIKPVTVEQDMHYDVFAQSLEFQEFNITSPRSRYELISPLLGQHQRNNCAVAIGIVEALEDCSFQVPVEAVKLGIKNIFWPGRFEVVNREPPIILDGAHNIASVKVLIDLMAELFRNRKITLVLGISEDKDVSSICKEFTQVIKHTIFVQADHPRAKNLPGAVSVRKALELVAQKSSSDDVVLITGSLFVVSEARAIIKVLEKGHQSPRVPVIQ